MTTFGEPATVARGNVAMPEARDARVTSFGDLDAAVAAVAAHKETWAGLGVGARIALLDRVIGETAAAAERWVALDCARRHVGPTMPMVGEMWSLGPWSALRYLRRLRATLAEIKRHGKPALPRIRTAADGTVSVRVAPADFSDVLCFTGYTADVRMAPGVGAGDADGAAGLVHRGGRRPGRVGVVLGAGNVSSIPFLDVIYKLFAEDQVVVLKLNPVVGDLDEVFTVALGALIEAGYLRIVHGGAREADHLVHADSVDTVHLTGSDKTYDAIVFGTGADAATRKAQDMPLLDKPVTAELGNVTPVIVVPGAWRAAELEYQARSLASMLIHGGSYECIAPRVLVTAAGWRGREPLLAALREALAAVPNQHAFYPGARERLELFTAAHPDAELVGSGPDGSLPWALIPGVDPAADDVVFSIDPFAPVLAETALPAFSVADFIDRAVAFCNERLWGTLAAGMLVRRRSLRGPATRAALDRALDNLRYGTIVVNAPTFLGFVLPGVPWGAHPGHRAGDIGSGCGVVHNSLLLDRSQKTIVRAPFRAPIKPPWWPDNRRARQIMRELTYFEADQRLVRLPPVMWHSMRG